jgi:DNA mismatch repair protein MutS
MMRQYLDLKAQHPGCMLFFRLGDFYEMFFEDAVKGAELLQITLTARAKGADKVPMCGVPYHSARRYIAKLIEQGLRVAICEQVEVPGSGPGIVRREVVRIITPGTVLDEEALDAQQNNFLAALTFDPKGAGAALLDVSTGDFLALEGPSLASLADELGRLGPREWVVQEGQEDAPELSALRRAMRQQPSVATLPKEAFELRKAEAYLKRHLSVTALDGFGLRDRAWATSAAGAALRYIKDTQKTDAPHVDRLSVLERGECLVMDEASRANLEVLRTLKDGERRGSLLGVLDRTVTSPGSRLLARWLSAPLRSLPEIQARLDAVGELGQKGAWREELKGELKPVADVERLLSRLSTGTGNARDLLALSVSLSTFPRLAGLLSRCESPLLNGLSTPLLSFEALEQTLKAALLDEPAVTLKEGGLIRPGFNAELDELVALSTEGKDFLLKLEQRERERTGISSLKVRFNRVFGYYLEVTRANLHLVPNDYIRKQTTVGSERYITPELKTYEEKVLHAEERRSELEYQLFEKLRAQVLAQASLLRAAAAAVATADCLLAFAQCAAEYGYVRPVVDDSGLVEISAGRHPVVERVLKGEAFVPNDLQLDRAGAQLVVLTGPNMAGKSTIMRQVALTVLMAQAGSFVPASAARVGVCDRIFTRVGAADNLAEGQSTFMVEMTETANILHHATRDSLVILDEIGRGTSTYDGLSIAWAVAEHLHDKVGARTLFATHYHELTELAKDKPRVRNASVAVKESAGKVTFLRKLVPEGASRSYGIEVARIAGLPGEVLARARQLLLELERGKEPKKAQLGLFDVPAPVPTPALVEVAGPSPEEAGVLEALRSSNLNALTPLAALNLLSEWQRALPPRRPVQDA